MAPSRSSLFTEDDQKFEQAVVGACIAMPKLLRDCELETLDFADLRHQAIWVALRSLEAAGTGVDTLTLEGELARAGRLDAAGGVGYFGEAILAYPTAENFADYARTVRDASLRRRVALAAGELLHRAQSGACKGSELLDEGVRLLGGLDSRRPDAATSIGDLVQRRFEAVDAIAQAQARGEMAITGAPTGVAELDLKTGGWRFGIVNMIAARPGMGKSAFGISTADACSRVGIGVHVFSLEDSWDTYADRVLARSADVPAIRLRQATIGREDTRGIVSAIARLRHQQGWILDDRGGLSAAEIIRSVRRHAERAKTRVVIVDYLQLVRARNPDAKEHERLGETMQQFVDAAKADDMAYVVMSQFNREVEKRPDKRPVLSDLRGSGEVEEKTKFCVGMYRGSYYGGKPKRDVDWECDCLEAARSCFHAPTLGEWGKQLQLMILKGGNGPTGMVMASWDGPTTNVF